MSPFFEFLLRPVVVLLRGLFGKKEIPATPSATQIVHPDIAPNIYYEKINKILQREYLFLAGTIGLMLIVKIFLYVFSKEWGLLLIFLFPFFIAISWSFVFLIPILLVFILFSTAKIMSIQKEIKAAPEPDQRTSKIASFAIMFNVLTILVLATLSFIIVVIKPF